MSTAGCSEPVKTERRGFFFKKKNRTKQGWLLPMSEAHQALCEATVSPADDLEMGSAQYL